MQPVPLTAKKVEARPLLVDIMKEVEEKENRALRNEEEKEKRVLEKKEEKENRMLKKGEEKENRVHEQEEQVSHSWRRSVAIAPRK